MSSHVPPSAEPALHDLPDAWDLGRPDTGLASEPFEVRARLALERTRVLARFLSRSDLRDLGLEEILGLAPITRCREVGSGCFVHRQGATEPGDDSIFVLARGAVSLRARGRGSREVLLAHLETGALFGGLPLVSDAPHAESALAESDCLLLEIDRDAYRHLAASRPWLAQRLALAVVRSRARRLHQVLAGLRDRL